MAGSGAHPSINPWILEHLLAGTYSQPHQPAHHHASVTTLPFMEHLAEQIASKTRYRMEPQLATAAVAREPSAEEIRRADQSQLKEDLRKAVINGNIKTARELLEKGKTTGLFDINESLWGRWLYGYTYYEKPLSMYANLTPLMTVIVSTRENEGLGFGSSPDAYSEDNQIAMLEMLVSMGADVNQKPVPDTNSSTETSNNKEQNRIELIKKYPINRAIAFHKYKVAMWLLQHGAVVTDVTVDLIDKPYNPDPDDQIWGLAETPEEHAARYPDWMPLWRVLIGKYLQKGNIPKYVHNRDVRKALENAGLPRNVTSIIRNMMGVRQYKNRKSGGGTRRRRANRRTRRR